MKISIRKIQLAFFAGMAFTALSSPGYGAGDAAAGEQKAAVCLTCHGKGNQVQGVGTPIISGQYEDYLIHAMQSYKSGDRNNPVMASFVTALSDQDIKDLAAFYSSMDSSLFTPVE